jgi:hypothetical protein
MANCKVGDLAIIVIDEALQENLGITVQVVSQAGYLDWYPYSKCLKRSCKRPIRLYSWNVVALSSKGICYRNYYGDLYYRVEGQFPDAYLQRLPKLPVDKEVFSEEGSGVLCEAERSDYETQI